MPRTPLVLALAAAATGAIAVATWLRSPLLEVAAPVAGERVGIEGVELLLRFRAPDRVEPATFRALLNGADVTDWLDVAANGVHGRLHGLLEGPNRLRLEVFGRSRSPWPRSLLVEHARELEVLYRPPPAIDRG